MINNMVGYKQACHWVLKITLFDVRPEIKRLVRYNVLTVRRREQHCTVVAL